MSYKYNIFTDEFDYYEPSDEGIDGGYSASEYLDVQSIDGGNA